MSSRESLAISQPWNEEGKRMGTRRILAAAFGALLLGSCSGQPIVADISQDKVILQGNGASPELLQAKATETCAMYKRQATLMSHRCGDQYCIQKIYLFACVPPPS